MSKKLQRGYPLEISQNLGIFELFEKERRTVKFRFVSSSARSSHQQTWRGLEYTAVRCMFSQKFTEEMIKSLVTAKLAKI